MTRKDVSRNHSVLAITYLLQHRPIQLSENNTEKSTNDISFESHFGKTYNTPIELNTNHKRKYEKELNQTDIESYKWFRKNESVGISPNLDFKE